MQPRLYLKIDRNITQSTTNKLKFINKLKAIDWKTAKRVYLKVIYGKVNGEVAFNDTEDLKNYSDCKEVLDSFLEPSIMSYILGQDESKAEAKLSTKTARNYRNDQYIISAI